MKTIFLLFVLSTSGVYANKLADGSFEYGGTSTVWNRMYDQAYQTQKNQWVVDDQTAYHGKKSLRSNGTEPLILMTEANGKPGVFSCYLKSESQVPVKVEIFSYNRLIPLELGSVTTNIPSKWTKVTVNARRDNRLKHLAFAPLFFKITPLHAGTLWIDAASYGHKSGKNYQEYHSELFNAEKTAEQMRRNYKPRLNLKFAPSVQTSFKPITFKVKHDEAVSAAPVAVTLPFAQGKWFGGGVQVKDDSGKVYEAQVIPLAFWPIDRSVRAAQLRFEANLRSGINYFTAEPGKVLSGTFKCYLPDLEVMVRDVGDNKFSSLNSPLTMENVEYDGPVYRSVVRRGLLVNTNEETIAEYILRFHFYRKTPGAGIEVTIINLSPLQPLVFRQAALLIKSGKPGKKAVYYQYYSPKTNKFSQALEPGYGLVSSAGGALLAPKAAEYHPTHLQVTPDGVFTASLWPSVAKPVIISGRAAIHRQFFWSPGNDLPVINRMGTFTVALADAKYFSDSDFFVIPTGSLDAKKFPYISKQFDRIEKDGRLTKNYLMRNNLAGIFNYGDVHGDGGWANLESFLDFSTILRSVAYDSLDRLDLALDRAAHYREIDTRDGMTVTHCPNHTGSVMSFSHSWPQGIVLHYLLTGSQRSLEVLKQIAGRYLEVPVNSGRIAQSRDLARYLLGLVDMYSVLDDNALKKRFYKQLRYAEDKMQRSSRPDKSIFRWHSRLVPFQVWYGACALMQMYKLTGDKKLLSSFRREMQASLDNDFYFLDLRECWPGVPPEKGLPIHFAFEARHRGVLFYPLMRFYTRIENNPHYLSLAQKACYADYLRGIGRVYPMSIFSLAVLNGQGVSADEKALLKEISDLVYNAAAPSLLNGDFSASATWFSYWHIHSRRSMSFDDGIKSFPLINGTKCFKKLADSWLKKYFDTVSPWRYYARLFCNLDRKDFGMATPSLRMQVSNRWALGRRDSLESVNFRIDPGHYRLSAMYRADNGIAPKTFARLRYVQLQKPFPNMMFHTFDLFAPYGEVACKSNGYAKSTLHDVNVLLSKSTKPGWHKFSLEFTAVHRGVGSIIFYIYLKKGHRDGFFNLDDVKLEKIK